MMAINHNTTVRGVELFTLFSGNRKKNELRTPKGTIVHV